MEKQTLTIKRLLTHKNFLIREIAKIALEKDLLLTIEDHDIFFGIATTTHRYNIFPNFIDDMRGSISLAEPGGFGNGIEVKSGEEVIKAMQTLKQ